MNVSGTATKVMLFAIVVGVIGRWANNQKAVPSATGLIQIVFALLLIAALDQGKTEPIAMGFAWIFLAAILLSNNSPLTGIAKLTNKGNATGAGQTIGSVATTVKK